MTRAEQQVAAILAELREQAARNQEVGYPDAVVHLQAAEAAVHATVREIESLRAGSGYPAEAAPDEPAVCDRCGAPKGLHAVGEPCNQNCGGKVIVRPRADAPPPNPYRTLHARMSPPGAAWDEGFAAGLAARDTPDGER